jgi:alcohol dehydrogenase
MDTDGGYAEYCRVPAGWVVPLPAGLTLREAMILGTAGFTAALGIRHMLQNGLTPEKGPVLVTGAAGGVGSVAVSILAKLGFQVTAAGDPAQTEYLKEIGAAEVIPREILNADSPKAMLKEQWAGAYDTVGGKTLENVIKSMRYLGVIANCGMVGGGGVSTTVFPFILRGGCGSWAPIPSSARWMSVSTSGQSWPGRGSRTGWSGWSGRSRSTTWGSRSRRSFRGRSRAAPWLCRRPE